MPDRIPPDRKSDPPPEGQASWRILTAHAGDISMFEKTKENGRSTIVLHSENGDILLSAPNGQVHIHSQKFTKETN
ncbi:MAG: hypothetical protein ABR907_15860 [Terracidiphilus sp.]